jgi:hypothetical protein
MKDCVSLVRIEEVSHEGRGSERLVMVSPRPLWDLSSLQTRGTQCLSLRTWRRYFSPKRRLLQELECIVISPCPTRIQLSSLLLPWKHKSWNEGQISSVSSIRQNVPLERRRPKSCYDSVAGVNVLRRWAWSGTTYHKRHEEREKRFVICILRQM